MIASSLFLILMGVLCGFFSAILGLGGGFMIVPLFLFMGLGTQKTVGTAFMVILLISLTALLTHSKLAHVDYRYGLLVGVGGIIGVQLGAPYIDQISPELFKKIFFVVFVTLGILILFKK